MTNSHFGILTTSRADYGLLKPLWNALIDAGASVSMLVTGSHLMASQGRTLTHIEQDGVAPLYPVDLQLVGDQESDLCQAMATGLVKFSQAFTELKLDLLIVLGDRYELLPACNAALIHKLPIAHLHGGEATFGLIDEAIRHSVSKMSALHFVAHEAYRNRVIQMGEPPDRVFNVGAIGLDNFRQVEPWSQAALEAKTGLDFNQPVLLVTFHPVTLDEYADAAHQADAFVQALENLPYSVLATLPNADTGGQQIEQRLQQAVVRFSERFKLVSSLGIKGYMAAMHYAAVMVGNSSSGILEAASFALPVVNVGDRQGGRIQPRNVIQCACETSAIEQAVTQALSETFQQTLQGQVSPYGDGQTAEKIVSHLQKIDLTQKTQLLKKQFYDLPVSCFEDIK